MQNLLTYAPSSVRDCLTKQLGVVAGKASCEAPWSTSLSLRVSLFSQALKIPDRATVSLGIANPLTGIDALVHGSDNLHGWGAPASTDATLLYVRGFNTTTNRYIYDVNPRFGSSRQANSVNIAPLQLTLDVSNRCWSGARASGLVPPSSHRSRRKGNKMNEQRSSSNTSVRIRIRSSRCFASRTRSA